MVVSHDRDFLNMVTTDIIHLHDLGLHSYRGNFAQFEEMYDQRRREQNKVAEKFEKQLKIAKKSGSKAAADKVGRLIVTHFGIGFRNWTNSRCLLERPPAAHWCLRNADPLLRWSPASFPRI